jgi:UDP-N-acetylglucosamine diphosphorylase/glucosamine-1-phosphate N-acetyltransferase
LRHLSQLRWGTKTLLDSLIESVSDATDVGLWGRDYLATVSREALKRSYNEASSETAVYVNARARPGKRLLSLTSRRTPFVALSGGHLVAARLPGGALKPGVVTRQDVIRAKKSTEDLEASTESLFGGYWDLVEGNGLAIAEQAGHFEDTMAPPSPMEVRGAASNLRIEGGVDVEPHVTFDVRLGPVVVERGTSIESFSRIMGPCYIGPRTKIFSALIGGGTSIYEGCRVGGQVENSLIMPYTNKAHHGYVGDSYVGEWVNLGAGSTFSNVKNTYGTVKVDLGDSRHDSGMLKLGPAVGDMCKVSIGALVYAGRLLGTGAHLAGLARQNVPSFAYLDGSTGEMVEFRLESVLEAQRRMMERRDKTLTRAEEGLIRKVYAATASGRKKSGVKKGRIR